MIILHAARIYMSTWMNQAFYELFFFFLKDENDATCLANLILEVTGRILFMPKRLRIVTFDSPLWRIVGGCVLKKTGGLRN